MTPRAGADRHPRQRPRRRRARARSRPTGSRSRYGLASTVPIPSAGASSIAPPARWRPDGSSVHRKGTSEPGQRAVAGRDERRVAIAGVDVDPAQPERPRRRARAPRRPAWRGTRSGRSSPSGGARGRRPSDAPAAVPRGGEELLRAARVALLEGGERHERARRRHEHHTAGRLARQRVAVQLAVERRRPSAEPAAERDAEPDEIVVEVPRRARSSPGPLRPRSRPRRDRRRPARRCRSP